MFPISGSNHPLWLLTAEIIFYLLIFVGVTAVIVFLLRGPLRRYKYIDLRIFTNISKWHTAANTRAMLAFTYLGKHNFLIPANLLLIAMILVSGHHNWYAFRLLVMSLSSLILMFILKHLFHRRRPLQPLLLPAKGLSFPSGHAIMSVNFYGLILYMLTQGNIPIAVKALVAIIIIILIVLIGFSRIYLQVHYASDVLAGFIIGLSWFLISLHILNRLREVMA